MTGNVPDSFDLLVVGGGVFGLGTAVEAAQHGDGAALVALVRGFALGAKLGWRYPMSAREVLQALHPSAAEKRQLRAAIEDIHNLLALRGLEDGPYRGGDGC